MFNCVSRYLSAAACALGMMVATGVQADDRDGWRHDRGSHHRRHDHGEWRHHARNHDRRHHDHRAYRGYRNEWRSVDYRGDWDRRDWDRGRYYRQHRCHDRRHYHRAHFHVPTRYYSRDVYAAFPYHGIYRDRGAEATVVLSFPL